MAENPSGSDEEGLSSKETTQQIAILNDGLRVNGIGGKVMMTRGVQALGEERMARAIQAMRTFDVFSPDNDPHGEHDFGSFTDDGKTFFWKIDYYDPSCTYGSENPADPAQTTRVLTLMLREEY